VKVAALRNKGNTKARKKPISKETKQEKQGRITGNKKRC
jgi:hypothetical protein